ncbi:MAG: polymer-forming cytoskeletal protein, partial [Spartobacteria bacterium]|nr:polymer-forming cytoskeletal protein [Spartobacteria bacterium]
QFRHVEVAGDLSASFEASGLVAIKATGVIRGDIRAARLSVEEGGGLLGQMQIEQLEAAK